MSFSPQPFLIKFNVQSIVIRAVVRSPRHALLAESDRPAGAFVRVVASAYPKDQSDAR